MSTTVLICWDAVVHVQMCIRDSGRIQLNEEVTVTLTLRRNIGLFGGFGSFPITLQAQATGKSEVYWK